MALNVACALRAWVWWDVLILFCIDAKRQAAWLTCGLHSMSGCWLVSMPRLPMELLDIRLSACCFFAGFLDRVPCPSCVIEKPTKYCAAHVVAAC